MCVCVCLSVCCLSVCLSVILTLVTRHANRIFYAPYSHLWPVRLCNNFPLYLMNGTTFGGKKLMNIKCGLIFSTTLVYNIILRRIQRYIIINVHWFSCKVPLFLPDCNETWLLSTDFRKPSNIIFHENPSSGSRVIPCRQTDGRSDMTKLIVAFRYFANVPNYYPKQYSRGAMYFLYDINRIFKWIWCHVPLGFPCQNFVFTCNICWNSS
jgi:hypothetical protein